MVLLEITTPDGRKLRQHHDSVEAAQAKLSPGYTVTARIEGADADGNGGLHVPLTGPTFMTSLLMVHSDELLSWLKLALDSADMREWLRVRGVQVGEAR
jgi:hypothetical protein